MSTLIAAVLTALSGGMYWLLQGTWTMPFWQLAPCIVGSFAFAEVLEDVSRRRRLRAGRARRAHARPRPATTTKET